MSFSPTSLLSCTISGTILILLACLALENDNVLKFSGRYSSIFLAVIAVRMAVPAEFGFTVTLISKRLLTGLRNFMVGEVGLFGHKSPVWQVLLAFWVAGAVGRLLILLLEYIRFSGILRRCPRYQKHDCGDAVRRINKEYGKDGKFEVRFVPSVQAPAIFGLVRPVILMPETDYTEEEFTYILKHEMMHYYHYDMLIKVFCEVFCTIYWWNPAVYLLKSLVGSVMEINVDCSLTSSFNEKEKISYLECIVKSMKAERGKKGADLLITFVPRKNSVMKQRFRCIWGNCWKSEKWKGAVVTLCSFLLYAISVSIVVEPYYDYELPKTFVCPDPETSFLVEKDGYYEFYLDGDYYGEMMEITEPVLELKVYKNLEEVRKEK